MLHHHYLKRDEYLTSPPKIRRSKFFHYMHDNRICVSGIAWDHYNVFPVLRFNKSAFSAVKWKMTEAAGRMEN